VAFVLLCELRAKPGDTYPETTIKTWLYQQKLLKKIDYNRQKI
jgi:hypothetical protein